MPPTERPDSESKAFFHAVMPAHPLVQIKPMFGQLAGFVHGNMFAGLYGDNVFVRLPDSEQAELLAEEGASPLEPMPGRPMKEYVSLPAAWRDDPDRVRGWILRGLNWVSRCRKSRPNQRGPRAVGARKRQKGSAG
jgi:TfoX/Sxy family transcriptional regulator of competence genes